MAYDLGLAERVLSILERRCAVVEKKMFGGVAFMVNGNMCCGVMKNDLMLRLTADQAAVSLGKAHTRPMAFSGKTMKSMVLVDPQGTDSDEALETWVELALTIVRTRPAKVAISRSSRAKRSKN